MIFKTFDSDIDKWTTKIGIFGKTFNELGVAVNNAFKTSINNIDNLDENVGFWESLKNNLFSPKNKDDLIKNTLGETVSKENIDSFIKELDTNSSDKQVQSILDHKKLVDTNKAGWQEYFETLKGGKEYLIDLIKNTDDLSKLTGEDLVNANKTARDSVLAHNAALQQQTLSAKAGQVVLDGLATAGNMLLAWGISEAISFAISGFDKLVNAEKYAQEAFEKAKTATDETAKSIRELKSDMSDTTTRANKLSSEYAKLAQGVNPLTNENENLSTDEYERFLEVNNQLAELFPSLTKNYDENGNAILGLSGDVDTVTASITRMIEQQAKLAKGEMRDKLDDYVNGTEDSDGVFTALEGYKKDVEEANDDLESLKSTYDAIINQKGEQTIVGDKSQSDYLNDIKDKLGQEAYDAIYNTAIQEVSPNGTPYFTIDFSKLQLDEETKEKITESYNTFYQDLKSNLETKTSELENKNQEMSDMMMVWVEDIDFYRNSEPAFQQAISTMVGSIKWSDMDVEEGDIDEAKQIIQSLVLTPLSTAYDDPDTKLSVMTAIQGLFTLDLDDMNIEDARAKINEFCTTIAETVHKDVEDVKQSFGFGDFLSTASKYDNLVAYASSGSYKTAKDVENSKGFDQKSVVKAMNDNGINTDEEMDRWKKILDTVNSLDEAIEKYKTQTEPSDKTTNLTFDEKWNSLDSDAKAREAKDQLLELAKAGKLTEKEFENSSIADTFKEAGVSAEEATKKINKMIDSAEQLSTMRTGISAITSAYDEKKNSKHKVVSASTIESLGDTLGIESWSPKNQKVWENYKNIAGDSSKSLKDLKTAQDQLATSFVTSNNFLSNLDNTNKDYYTGLLEEMGVLNAESIVNQALIASEDEATTKKINNKLATIDFINATNSELTNLGNELTALYGSSEALGLYIIKKQLASGNALSTSESIGNLIALAEQCGYTGAAIQTLSAMQKNQKQLENLDPNDPHAPDIAAKIEYENKGLKEQLDKYTSKKIKLGKVKTTDVNNTNNSPTDKDSGKESKQQFDWLERRLTRMQNIIDATASKLQNLFSVKAKNKNLDEQIKQTTKLLNQYKAAAKQYQNKADKIAKGSKKTKGLSDNIVKKVQSGEVTKANYTKLFKGYSQSDYEKISKYIDYYDKSQNAKKSVQEQIAKKRELKIQKLTNLQEEQDKFAEQYNAEQQNAVLSKKNDFVINELVAKKKSYDYQIKIAKENNDLIEQAKLRAEKERAIAEAYQQQVDNIKALYDAKRNALDTGIVNNNGSRKTYGEQYYKNQVDLIESRGLTVDASWYLRQNEIERQKISEANEERNALIKQLQNFTEGTEEWYNLQSDITECDNAIVESQKTINDNSAAVRELKNVIDEKKAKYLDDLSNEISFIDGLMRGENTDSSTGTFTDKGNLSAYAEALNSIIGKEGAKHFGEELQQLEDLYSRKASKDEWEKNGFWGYFNDNGSLNIEAIEEDIDELRKKQQDYIQFQFGSEEKLIDLAKEKYEAQKQYLQDVIDAKKEALDIEKDLYDYERNIADKTKNVADLQKQINALQGDDSEEGRARLAKLQVSLDDAQKDLQDTEYERYISDQQKMLDNLMSEYEDLITNLMKDTDAILWDILNYVQSGKSTMGELLLDTAKEYGYATTGNLLDVVNALSNKEYSIVEGTSGTKHISEVIKEQLNNTGDGSSNTNTSSAQLSNSTSASEAEILAHMRDKEKQANRAAADEKATTIKKELKNMTGMGSSVYWKKSDGTPKSYTNQRIKASKINGKKILTESGARALAEALKGKKDFDFDKNVYMPSKTKDQVFAALNKYFKASSFATGGIASFKPDGEDGLAWVRNGEALVPPEKWEQLASLLQVVPQMEQITTALIKSPDISPSQALMEQSIGNVEFAFNLPNVTDSNSFLIEIQNNPKLQRALQEVTLGQTNGNGRLSVNRIR